MAWGFVADGVATNTGGATSLAITYTPTAVGNRLIVYAYNANSAPTTCADTAGNTWHLDAQKSDAGPNVWVSVFSAPITAGAGSADTITISGFLSNRAIMNVREVSGLSTATGTAALDGTASATGTATALSSGNTASTTAANEYVFGGIAWDGQPTPVTVGSGFGDFFTNFPVSPVKGLGAEDKDSGASGGAQAATATQTGTAVTWCVACVVYQLAATAGGPTYLPQLRRYYHGLKPTGQKRPYQLPYASISSLTAINGEEDGLGALTGTLGVALALSGSIAAASTTSGNLVESVAIGAASTGAALIKASLTLSVGLQGTVADPSALTGSPSVAEALQATASALSADSATLTSQKALSGSAVGLSSLSGALALAVAMAASASAPAVLNANLQVVSGSQLVGLIAGSSRLAATLQLSLLLTGKVNALGLLAGILLTGGGQPVGQPVGEPTIATGFAGRSQTSVGGRGGASAGGRDASSGFSGRDQASSGGRSNAGGNG